MMSFFEMDGYGIYIWASYGLTGLFIVICTVHSLYKAKQIDNAHDKSGQ